MNYTQLTQEQRYQISALLKMGHNRTEIAAVIGKHKSTISREVGRNKGQRGYRPNQAHHKALHRRNRSHKRILGETWELIETKLRLDWSPEQVSGWLKRYHAIQVSHEWIYQHILADKQAGGDLYRHLRCQKKRRKRYGSYDRRGKIPNRVSIDERPAIVEERTRIGDWEVDTIIGKRHRQAIVTLTERKSRFSLLAKVNQRTADKVGGAIIELLQNVVDRVHTLTADNGKEFADHERIAHALQADFFFAHPYAAWERGSNENMNGLIRQYIPKKCDLKIIDETAVEFIMDRLNNRPRKCLDFMSPLEMFLDQSVALQS
jgi:transposase, IS30 family